MTFVHAADPFLLLSDDSVIGSIPGVRVTCRAVASYA